MIVRSKPNLINVLISLKGSIAKRIALRSLLVTLLASAIVFIETLYPAYFSRVNATPFTLLGLSLSIFMSFRNNACYDRWYEARKALGTLVTEVRSMIRETQAIKDSRQRGKILRDLCGFAHALNARLRQEDESSAAGTWLSRLPPAQAPNVPDSILRHVGQQCSTLAESGVISEWRYTLLANHLSSLTNAQTICERIKSTPLPFPYTLLLHRTSYIFCILLPFAMAEPLGWLTPIFWPSSVIRSSVWMPLATSWKTPSAGTRTTCRPTPWYAPSSVRCWMPWGRPSCRRCCSRWTSC